MTIIVFVPVLLHLNQGCFYCEIKTLNNKKKTFHSVQFHNHIWKTGFTYQYSVGTAYKYG